MKEEMSNRIDRLDLFVPKEHQKTVREIVISIVETAQDEAFLEGYRYAIAVLNDGLIKKKH